MLTAVTVLTAQGRLCLGHSNDCREVAAQQWSERPGHWGWSASLPGGGVDLHELLGSHQGSWDPECPSVFQALWFLNPAPKRETVQAPKLLESQFSLLSNGDKNACLI